ncbi:MAG: CHAD domain-containing protein [Acidaminococcaceae bacterium]|nr:CHAD domain-containing protein [Acidaminococcaceae bacterium]
MCWAYSELCFSETELQTPAKNSELRLIAREGIIIMEARLLPLREMIVVYTSRELPKLQTAVEKLCCRMSLIIAEPNLKQRLAQELGTYDFRKLPAYKNGSLWAMAVCHLPWQIYVVSKAWQQFLQQPEEKVFIRQLRVKLRRLRSTLSFLSRYCKEAAPLPGKTRCGSRENCFPSCVSWTWP